MVITLTAGILWEAMKPGYKVLRTGMAKLPFLLLPFVLLTGCAHISATIQAYHPADPTSPLQIAPGEEVTLAVTVANTGNRARPFEVRATLRNADNVFLRELSTQLSPPLEPGEERTVSWTVSIDQPGEYWLQFSVYYGDELLAEAPASPQLLVLAQAPASAQPVSEKFSPGERVRVMEPLNLREGPGISHPEVDDPNYPGALPVGSLGNVIGGPVAADGHTWWQVEFDRGVSGWCVEEGLESLDVLLGRKPSSSSSP